MDILGITGKTYITDGRASWMWVVKRMLDSAAWCWYRTVMSNKQVQVAFRLDEQLVKEVDHHVERMQKLTPGLTITRTDAVRSLLVKALTAEAEVEARATIARHAADNARAMKDK